MHVRRVHGLVHRETTVRLTRRMGVLSVAIVVAGKVSMAPAAGAQYSYVPSPPPCPAPPPPIPPAMKRKSEAKRS